MGMTAPSILLVEDDISCRTLLSLELRGAGYEVDTVPGGREALGLLERKPYDWLVTDGRMAEIDGVDLSRLAKKIRPSLGIIMVSAVYGDRDVKDAPIDKLFPKPIVVEDLLRWLRDEPPTQEAVPSR